MDSLYFPVVDGVSGDVDRYGYARTREEAISLANEHFADEVVDAFLKSNIHLRDGVLLPMAWVAVTCQPSPRCPYCGNTGTVEIGDWKAVSVDDVANHADLTEYQCRDCCGRSFWI